jgi:hypothetical protein
MAGEGDQRPHLMLQGITQTDRFKSPRQVVPPVLVPSRNRPQHAALLREALAGVNADAVAARQAQRAAGLDDNVGLRVEFEGYPDIKWAFESLAPESKGIELLNVRQENQKTLATVFVPDGQLPHFEKLISEYVEERRSKNGRRLDHSDLINAIQNIRTASLRALWTDDPTAFPASDEEVLWWEVWLPVRDNREATNASFERLAQAQQLEVAQGHVRFPERTVFLVRANAAQLKQSVMTLNCIAELRRAKETADFFDALSPEEQPAWVDDLIARTALSPIDPDTPYVCVLDTGINAGHRLLTHPLAVADRHTIEPAWGTDDLHGHGTGMAGLILYGDLTRSLAHAHSIGIDYRLESVKVLEENGANAGSPSHHGYLTAEATSRPEITAPNRTRVFAMAITTRDDRDRGRPSAWSATIDRLASDADNQGETRRLFVISAGNVDDPNAWMTYPDSNTTDGIHDPGQAWNALTVGAYTELVDITEPDAAHYQAIAPQGGLSPFSTTSQTWSRAWPLKPDVVFEGGNAAKDGLGAAWMPSLSLLTAHHRPQERLLTTSNATSAAMALGARMSAQLMAAYPHLWPEAIRALIVHSAQWTDAMRAMFLPQGRPPTKGEFEYLIRHCGFGVPNLDQARWSASDSLTLVVQESLHPFQQENSKSSMRDMHMHRLPWPIQELEALGDKQVQMRVTLSYFIEPNPSARGRSRYRYESYGLRFEVKRPLESDRDFLARINADARDEEYGTPAGGNDPDWLLGKQKRHHGSIHTDVWTGTAAALASRGMIGVYPAMGWWRTRPKLERGNSSARYALLVSIRAPETDVDLYAAIENRIVQPVAIAVGNDGDNS